MFIISSIKCYIYRFQNYLYNRRIRERKLSWGKDNPDKIFYVVGVDFGMAGIFAIVKSFLSHIVYAEEKGYIPVIDMQNYKNQFRRVTDKANNPWELFFSQPSDWTIDAIKHSKNIIKSSNMQVFDKKYECSITFLSNPVHPRLDDLSVIYKKYFHFSPDTYDFVVSQYEKVIGTKENIVGVLCRGTDYTQKRPKYHPIQPTPEMVYEKLLELRKAYHYEYVYLATEDENVLSYFKTKFSNKLLYINQIRFDRLENISYLSEIELDSRNLIELNRSYLASLYILSKCNYLIGGRTSGSMGAYLMSNGFQYTYFFDLGFYN